MPTQIEFVRKWGVSKGIISRYHNLGMPLTSFDAAEQWVAENVPFGKVHCAAEEARIGPLRLEPEPSDVKGEPEELLGSKLFDPCPDLKTGTPDSSAIKYICWGLYFRGLTRSTAEWMANYLVKEIKAGRGDEFEDDRVKRLTRKKSNAKSKREKVPAKG